MLPNPGRAALARKRALEFLADELFALPQPDLEPFCRALVEWVFDGGDRPLGDVDEGLRTLVCRVVGSALEHTYGNLVLRQAQDVVGRLESL